MKVLDTNLAGTSAASQAPSPVTVRQSGVSTSSPGLSGGGDRVELSGFTGKLSQALAGQTQDRATRVAALARDYQAGRYSGDANQTSHAIVQETLDASPAEKGA